MSQSYQTASASQFQLNCERTDLHSAMLSANEKFEKAVSGLNDLKLANSLREKEMGLDALKKILEERNNQMMLERGLQLSDSYKSETECAKCFKAQELLLRSAETQLEAKAQAVEKKIKEFEAEKQAWSLQLREKFENYLEQKVRERKTLDEQREVERKTLENQVEQEVLERKRLEQGLEDYGKAMYAYLAVRDGQWRETNTQQEGLIESLQKELECQRSSREALENALEVLGNDVINLNKDLDEEKKKLENKEEEWQISEQKNQMTIAALEEKLYDTEKNYQIQLLETAKTRSLLLDAKLAWSTQSFNSAVKNAAMQRAEQEKEAWEWVVDQVGEDFELTGTREETRALEVEESAKPIELD